MRKRQFPLILVLILFFSYAIFHLAGLVLAAIVLFLAYLSSLRLHPRMRHTGWRGCGGSGEVRGSVFTWTFRKCPRCNSGRLIRWGAGQWGAGHIRAERKRAAEGRANARSNNSWR